MQNPASFSAWAREPIARPPKKPMDIISPSPISRHLQPQCVTSSTSFQLIPGIPCLRPQTFPQLCLRISRRLRLYLPVDLQFFPSSQSQGREVNASASSVTLLTVSESDCFHISHSCVFPTDRRSPEEFVCTSLDVFLLSLPTWAQKITITGQSPKMKRLVGSTYWPSFNTHRELLHEPAEMLGRNNPCTSINTATIRLFSLP